MKIEVTLDLSRSMLTSEENIQQSLNHTGCLATEAALQYLDTDGSAIEIAGEVMRTKGKQPKAYQTPYGEVVIKRHVYQRSGGKTYCPMERESRIIITSTPLESEAGVLETGLWFSPRCATRSRGKQSPSISSVLYPGSQRSGCQYH
ncbi:MAG: hypothetical protein KME05_20190 [Gloeocapsa sp. UFS-A4-WI-NPMV-4B04]|nr:hypothetical protein [Gloeocapsa sp. UFS-A4-WI-NPMV-4B04]